MKQLGLCKWMMRVVLCLVSSALIAVTVTAQTSTNATLRGNVTDETGAVIPGAKVTLINDSTKDTRKTETNNAGIYVLSSVPSGIYKLEIEKDGFKKQSQTGLTLSPADTRGLDIIMTVGAQSETVTITAGNEALQTETGAKENTITAKQIENISLVGRGALELLRIMPGVVAPDASDLQQIGFGSGANANDKYNVNGLRGQNNNVSIDGARMMDIGANNGTVITANPDMVQEIKIQTSNYAAEHGTAAINIHATTKSGGSGYHGSIYDYSRDYRVGANDRSNTIKGIARPASQYNYPGGNIGGPIPLGRLKEKLFFFTGFEYYYQQVDEGASSPTWVPTLKMRKGDFSDLTDYKVLVPPGCNIPSLGYEEGKEAPNKNLAPCADKTGLGPALLNLYPLPNYSGKDGTNYIYSVLRPNIRNQWIGRFDYNVSERTKLYVRLAREHEAQGFPRGLWWDSSNFELPGNLKSDNLGRSAIVNLTNIISPTMTNEVLFGASKLKTNFNYADPDKVSYEALGVKESRLFPSGNPYVPLSVVNGWGSNMLNAYGFPIIAWNDSFSISDNLTKIYNSHAFKFGAVIEQANKKQQSNSDVTIVFDDSGNITRDLDQYNRDEDRDPSKVVRGRQFNRFGDVYAGFPTSYGGGTDRPGDLFRYYNYEFYAQDSWKVRPSFTLEYGVRVGYLPQNFERNGHGVLFDPKSYDPKQGLFLLDANGNPDKTRVNGMLRSATGQIPLGVLPNIAPQFMPRLNFAWDIGGKGDWVIRGGAGVFYNRVQGNYDYDSSGQPPNTYKATITAWNKSNLSLSDLTSIDPFSNIGLIDIKTRNGNSNEIPRTATMSLTVEKRLPAKNVLTVAYVGTQARHLPQQRATNIIPLNGLMNMKGVTLTSTMGVIDLDNDKVISEEEKKITTHNIDLSDPTHRAALNDDALRKFLPYSAYNAVGVYDFTGTSSYHSLQSTLSKQTGKLTYFLTYTFSKALGTVATNESDGSAWADPIDTRGRSWGILPFDRTHIFNMTYNYFLPDLAKGFLNKPVLRGAFNGWQVSGITTLQSGIPIRLRFSGDINSADMAQAWHGTNAYNTQGNSAGAITPIYLKNPTGNDLTVQGKYFNLNALAIPAFGESGPAQQPFHLRTPTRSNFDLSFFKTFKITESKSIQFRSGFFNIFNQAYPTVFNVDNPGQSDIYLRLEASCNKRINRPNGNGGVSENMCDPRGGFTYTKDTTDNFGKVQNKRGRRIVEFAVKFYF